VVLAPTLAGAGVVPRFTMGAAVVLTVLNFGLLLPYFGHVFAFLEPNSIITRIQRRAVDAIARMVDVDDVDPQRMGEARDRIANSVERIADNCTAAINQSDRALALHTVRTLERFIEGYCEDKDRMPPGWARADRLYFGTLSEDFFDEIVAHGDWVEAKTLLEFERIFLKAVRSMNALASQLASSTRVIGLRAAEQGDMEVLELAVRFFNTYLRHSINTENVRAAYNVLYEYRQLVTELLDLGPEFCLRIVGYFIYYGRLCNAMDLPFVTVTAAHDVRVICEEAYRHGGFEMHELLDQFLSLDQPAESYSGEVALVGVRKAQSILGAFLLAHDERQLADRIRRDMHEDKEARLESIRDEILAVEERRFWEVTERGFNFDYVEPEMRPFIVEFFEPLIDAQIQAGGGSTRDDESAERDSRDRGASGLAEPSAAVR
jgi:hypothetical protein